MVDSASRTGEETGVTFRVALMYLGSYGAMVGGGGEDLGGVTDDVSIGDEEGSGFNFNSVFLMIGIGAGRGWLLLKVDFLDDIFVGKLRSGRVGILILGGLVRRAAGVCGTYGCTLLGFKLALLCEC